MLALSFAHGDITMLLAIVIIGLLGLAGVGAAAVAALSRRRTEQVDERAEVPSNRT